VILLCPMCAQEASGAGSLAVMALIAVPFAVSAAVLWAIRHLEP